MLVRCLILAFALVTVLAICPSHAATIQWSDGEFNPANWEMTTILFDGNGGEGFATQVPNGGNPGAFRRITITVFSAPPYSGIVLFSRYLPATYDPSTQGALLEVEFDEDAVNLGSVAGGQSSGPVIRQGGVAYVTDWYGITQTVWTHHQLVHLTQSDFHLYGEHEHHPDFSESGGPMEFGFFRGNSTYSGGYTTICGIDNWSMILTTAEPTPAQAESWGRIKSLYR